MNYDYNGKKHRFVYVTGVEMSAVATKVGQAFLWIIMYKIIIPIWCFVYITKLNFVRNYVSQQIIKIDVETKKTQEWTADNCWPSEAVFIGRPNAIEEDDGKLNKYSLTSGTHGPYISCLFYLFNRLNDR